MCVGIFYSELNMIQLNIHLICHISPFKIVGGLDETEAGLKLCRLHSWLSCGKPASLSMVKLQSLTPVWYCIAVASLSMVQLQSHTPVWQCIAVASLQYGIVQTHIHASLVLYSSCHPSVFALSFSFPTLGLEVVVTDMMFALSLMRIHKLLKLLTSCL